MIASTYPTTRCNHYSKRAATATKTNMVQNFLPREVQIKKDFLKTLERALEERLTEFRELCLKEGELTGQLPIDYPLKPREPIPQIRRRNVIARFPSREPSPIYTTTTNYNTNTTNKNLSTNYQQNFKTTRQLQEDVMRKDLLRFSACDDQIQASVKLIEKSSQKLFLATAKAIKYNPGLAEKLSNLLPSNNGEIY